MLLEHAPQREAGAVARGAPLELLLTVAQVAEITSRSISTLEKDRLFGSGPRYVKLGRVVRYRPAWLSERVRRSTSEAGE